VVDQRLLRRLGQCAEHLSHVARAVDRRPVGQLEDEIAKAEVVEDVLTELLEQVWRALAQKIRLRLGRFRQVLPVHGLQEDRKVLVVLPDQLGEANARLRIHLPVAWKADVGDDPEHVLGEVLVKGNGLLEGLCQEDFRPRPDAQQSVREIDAFGHQTGGLDRDLRVDVGQVDGVIPRLVLDQNDRLHAAGEDVVLGVPPVLHLFDHGENRLHVALPQKHPVERLGRPQLLEPRQLPGVSGEQADGQLRPFFLDPANQLADLHVRQARRRDHHVEGTFLEQPQCFGGLRRAREPRGELQVELEVAELLEDQLGELAVLLEDERIVMRGHQENLDDPVLHQRRELLGPHPVPAGQLDRLLVHGIGSFPR